MLQQPEPCCPVCGGDLHVHLGVIYHAESGTLVSSNYSIAFSRREAQIFDLLWRYRSRRLVSAAMMMDHLYGDDPNGGALDKIIQVWICRIRKKLFDAGADIDIETEPERGYRLKTSTQARRPRAKMKVAA